MMHSKHNVEARLKAKVTITCDKLGQGGYGLVYSGTWPVNNDVIPAAFKKASIMCSESEFEKEIALLKKLDHVFIVNFFGIHTKESIKYIAMELCNGNLTQYVGKKLSNIPKDSSLDRHILRQVALGLSYLHGREPPIIHKDLKPDNILLKVQKSDQIWAKLTDFGYSREKPADQTCFSLTNHLGASGFVASELLSTAEKPMNQTSFPLTNHLGTSGFIAPELLKTKIPSLASDVWSYGAVFFYVVSNGEQPHDVSGIQIDQLKFRNYFIETYEVPPNLPAVTNQLDAAELAFNLLNYSPSKRPRIFLVPYHPYFSLSTASSRSRLMKKVGDFWHIHRKNERKQLEALFSFKRLKQWLQELDQTANWTEVKKEIAKIIRQVYGHDTEDSGDTLEIPGNSLKVIRDAMESELNDLLSLEFRRFEHFGELPDCMQDWCRILDAETSQKLFAAYISFLLNSLNFTEEEFRNRFQTSELEDVMIYHKFIYFEEMWHSINREIKQNEKDNLLILATFCRLPEFAEFLVRNGADPNYSDVHGYKAIRYAAEQKRPIINLFRCLLDAGSEVNGPILSQRFLLLSPDIVELLLQRGADPNECNSAALRMSIPIYFSVSLESVEKECLYKTIELLLKHKADPNITCDGEEPILQQAVTYRNFQIFQLLVEHGADFNGNHYNAVSVFHRTICYGFEHMIELLLQKGADPDAVNNEGRTPLQLAVINYCKIEIFKILLENPYRRADPNAVDSSGRTALHYTVSYGCNAEIISFLVEHGADPERVDQTGKKPRDYLREEHKTRKIMKLLGAKL